MNEEIIQEIVRKMLPHLNNEQLKKLKNVLEDTLHGFTVLLEWYHLSRVGKLTKL